MSHKNLTSLIVAESDAMKAVVTAIGELAETDDPVLIQGEVGTGRELIARVIHMASARRLGGLATINGATAAGGTFGDPMRGATSTFVRVCGGTLLVKDLCALPKAAQGRLLEVLEHAASGSRPDTIRVIASDHLDVVQGVRAGVLLEALYGRLSARRIVVPPLRDRIEDLPSLATSFVHGYGRAMGRERLRLSTRAVERLIAYPWPGNVAELNNVCRRLALRACEGKVEAEDVDAVLPLLAERRPAEDVSLEDLVRAKLIEFLRQMDGYPLTGLYDEFIARVERPLLSVILDHVGHNQVKAAEILGVSRNTLRRKLGALGLRPALRSARRSRQIPARTKRGASQ